MDPSHYAPFEPAADQYPGPAVPLLWKRIVDLRMDQPGIKGTEIARELGINQQTVYLITRKVEYQKYEDWRLRKVVPLATVELGTAVRRDAVQIVREKYETYLDEMQDRLMHILETTQSEKLQVEIIHDTYDRMGFVSKKDSAARVTPIVMTGEAMREFMNRAKEAGLPDAIVVEAELAEKAS